MKNYLCVKLFILNCLVVGSIYAQQKEVLILGTMHTVPSIVKHSYSPMLKKALKYHPDFILTEDIMPTDSLSQVHYTPRFLEKAHDALQLGKVDENRVQQLFEKSLSALDQQDFEYLAKAFLQQKDRANFAYYNYLSIYGLNGSVKPLRNESDDVTHPLAIALGIRRLLPIDNHHFDKEYNAVWGKAVNAGKENGDLKKYIKLQKKNTRKQNINGLFGRLARFTNRPKTLDYYYQTNSVRYVENPNELTTQAQNLWDKRNEQMAQNILYQLDHSRGTRYVLIVGAGHVLSLQKALQVLRPELVVKTWNDL